jgi:hypothetical protein
VNERKAVICGFLTKVTMKMTVLYNVMLCSLAGYYQCFGGRLCVLLQGRIILKKADLFILSLLRNTGTTSRNKKAHYLKLLKWNPDIL